MASKFHSLPKSSLIALTNAGGVIAGDWYFCADSSETFLGITGTSTFPMSSVILTGEYQLEGPASTVPGPQGPAGPAGPAGSPGVALAQVIALTIALG
jgi:hypothetical protein